MTPDRLFSWLPVFTGRDVEMAYRRGLQFGNSRGYFRGYRQGVEDTHAITKLRAIPITETGQPLRLVVAKEQSE